MAQTPYESDSQTQRIAIGAFAMIALLLVGLYWEEAKGPVALMAVGIAVFVMGLGLF